MIGVIQVKLRRGEFAGQNQLREIASSLYPHEVSADTLSTSLGIQQYVRNLPSIYTCSPRNAARALFLWLDAETFEVVLETSYQGHLLSDSEGVVRRLSNRLRQLNMRAEITITMHEPADAQTYIIGSTKGKTLRVWNRVRDSVVALLISILILMAAKLWLPDYFQEAIASAVALFLFLSWQIMRAVADVFNTNVEWVING